MKFFIIFIIIVIAIYILTSPVFWGIILFLSLVIAGLYLGSYLFFKSKKFNDLKQEVSNYVDECNELNEHIVDLKNSQILHDKKDYGIANSNDLSKHNFKRKELSKFSNSNLTYHCSLQICRNAQNKPFEYLCKYFDIPKTEESLIKFETMLNNFSAVEEGRNYLLDKKSKILNQIQDKIPLFVKTFFQKTFQQKLGFEPIDLSNLHFFAYKFQYISSGGNSSMETEIIMDIENLEKFINYLDQHIKWRKSIKGQRSLMTSKLRNEIKERDNFTCCNCSNSTAVEPNLLLEIDHIIPLSKGGLSTKDNLQTLCWKCNRTKGAKI